MTSVEGTDCQLVEIGSIGSETSAIGIAPQIKA